MWGSSAHAGTFKKNYILMKVLKWLAFFSAGIGAVLMLIGVVSTLTLRNILDAIYIASYFLGANSFLLITTVILLFIHLRDHRKE